MKTNVSKQIKEHSRLVSLAEINPETSFFYERAVEFFILTVNEYEEKIKTLNQELGILNDRILTLESNLDDSDSKS